MAYLLKEVKWAGLRRTRMKTLTQVKSGVNKDSGKPQTEFVVAQRDGSGHDHITINENGDVTSHTFRTEK